MSLRYNSSMIKAIFIFMSIVVVSGSCYAETICKSPFINLLNIMEEKYPTASNHLMNPVQSKQFVRAYNNMPPKTNFTSDSVVMFTKPTETKVLFVLIKKLCIQTWTQLTSQQFNFMMQRATSIE